MTNEQPSRTTRLRRLAGLPAAARRGRLRPVARSTSASAGTKGCRGAGGVQRKDHAEALEHGQEGLRHGAQGLPRAAGTRPRSGAGHEAPGQAPHRADPVPDRAGPRRAVPRRRLRGGLRASSTAARARSGCCVEDVDFDCDPAGETTASSLRRIEKYQAAVDKAKACFDRAGAGAGRTRPAGGRRRRRTIDKMIAALAEDPAKVDLKKRYAEALVAQAQAGADLERVRGQHRVRRLPLPGADHLVDRCRGRLRPHRRAGRRRSAGEQAATTWCTASRRARWTRSSRLRPAVPLARSRAAPAEPEEPEECERPDDAAAARARAGHDGGHDARRERRVIGGGRRAQTGRCPM